MKAISFLGPSNYAFTKYQYQGQIVPTRFFAEALLQFFPELEEILVVITPTVKRHDNWEELQTRLGGKVREVLIPELHTPKEPFSQNGERYQWENTLWEIFDALVSSVASGEEVIFDITNSFRSIPFLVFMAAIFLRAARQVHVRAVLYGAFEARDKETNISPVFDLTPFVTLFDWLAATNQFLYTGNARYLASQLRKQQSERLASLADHVERIALGLELLRPRDVAHAAQTLPQQLKSVEEALLPKPFSVVVQRLEEAYSLFGVPPTANDWDYLRSQLKLLEWYFDKQHYVHALSLAREWVVSLLCVHFGEDMWSYEARRDIELLLNGPRKDSQGNIIKQSRHTEEWKNDPRRKAIARLWQGEEPGEAGKKLQLANLRNDVLHTGFRKDPKKVEVILEQTQRIIEHIRRIAQQWPQLQNNS